MSAEQDSFAKAVGALRPYLSDLVVVGGWAHRLYRLRPGATVPSFRPLVTDDADVAAPTNLAMDRPPINVLLTAAGFKEDLRGDESRPVARYILEGAGEPFELEFIADLRGSTHKRRGRDATVIVAGVSAQKLRHVDALLVEPWTVHLDESVGYAVPGGSADVLIPNAAAYLFQKVIVLPRRAIGKGPKDVLYIFDTLRLFASSLQELRERWAGLSPHLAAATRRRFFELQAGLFKGDSDFVVTAAVIARDTGRPSPPPAATIAATCRAGLDAVFGSG